MSEPWDDDDSAPEQADPPHGPVRVNAEIDIQRGEIVGELARQILARFDERYSQGENVNRAINALVDKHLTEKVKAIAEERVAAAVEKAIADGWEEPKAYDYDRSAPKRVTIESLVKHALTHKYRDRNAYSNDPERTLVEHVIHQVTSGALTKMLTEELAAAKAKFKASVDALIEKNVLEAARAALKGER